MALSEDQIRELLDWFVHSSETRRKWKEGRDRALEENHKWINPEVIPRLSDKDLEEKFMEYYRIGGGRQNLNQIHRDRIIRDKKRFRAMIAYLLDEKISPEKRMEDVLDGKYHIEGLGRAIVPSFLMDFNPDKYCLWNNKTEMGFSALGWGKVYENRESWGAAYQKVLGAIKKIVELKQNTNLSFSDVDLFLHTISAEEEGKQAVKAVTEGGDIQKKPDGIPGGDQTGVEGMEFAMEKYLEEFIEINFKRIDFGAKLDLCQDEENTGRQYPTPIGNIDLLAEDREKKEFVVMELKKGRSSDVVVGQILRYMGWVKENLPKDHHKEYDVRGIIILREKDERLEYALSMMPKVSLFQYEVYFKINKLR